MKSIEVVGNPHSFICSSFVSEEACDGLIDFFQETKNETPELIRDGEFFFGNESTVDKSKKDSKDMTIQLTELDPRWLKYSSELAEVSQLYREKYVDALDELPWTLLEGCNIQWYPPGGGYHDHHSERAYNATSWNRLLVWMTYLTDIEVGGGTRFTHYDITTKPKKGLTLIWPADWVWRHHGVVAPNEEKWIITGWYSVRTTNKSPNSVYCMPDIPTQNSSPSEHI